MGVVGRGVDVGSFTGVVLLSRCSSAAEAQRDAVTFLHIQQLILDKTRAADV